MEQSRAQQLENWMNQQEILQSKNAQRQITESLVKFKVQVKWIGEPYLNLESNVIRYVCMCLSL
jgi:hypothetical protein